MAISWRCAGAAEITLDRNGSLWAPFLEWSLDNATFEGNPFDVLATATFTHEASGEQHTTPMYFAGDRTWRFRFTGTQTGRWEFSTQSQDPELNGHRGVVEIGPSVEPAATGFITHVGNKWARPSRPDGRLEAFVPQLVMYATPKYFHEKPEKIDADIATFLAGHGFNGFHVMGSCHWFDIHQQSSRDIEIPNPDPRTFEALELLITRTHAAGGMVHLWAWGDDYRNWTPTRWGKNGKEDRRLQRYIAARLGPLPGWTMGYGFDNFEWVQSDDLRKWHSYLHGQMGWPHLLGARAHSNRLSQIFEGLDYAAYEQHQPDYDKYVETIERRPGKPSFSEDRFRIRKNSQYAFKDYDMEMTRRGLWHSTMAGGVANIWGHLAGDSSDIGSTPYPHPEWIKAYAQFFRGRFAADLVRDNRLTDGRCLKRPGKGHYLFYKEGAASVLMDLSEMSGTQHAVAVDARKPYTEIDLGPLPPSRQTWTAPHQSDWAIAVGDFDPR